MAKQYYPAPTANENAAPALTKSEIKHLIKVNSVSGRMPERDVALLLCSITTGLRVTEIAHLEVWHIVHNDGSLLVEGWIPGKFTKSGEPGPVFITNKKFKEALNAYFEYRIRKGHQVSGKPEYMGLKPDKKVFLTEKGHKFAMSNKKRYDSEGNEKVYKACDVLERAFKRFYQRAFGEKTDFSSHSGRRTFCNRLLEIVESKKVEDAGYDDIVTLMRSRDITSIQPYLTPTKDEVFSMAKNLY